MSKRDIRDLVHQSPFKPFRLHLADGKDLRVPHPDFALVAAEYVVVANEMPGGQPGNINLVPYEHIVRVEMLPVKMRRAA
ncbi:MAG: hypothetical protein HY301_03625 [Verrucomicrobia bacterium]|nr:hypothetical protein [Verrucomicrobiota bacterium]